MDQQQVILGNESDRKQDHKRPVEYADKRVPDGDKVILLGKIIHEHAPVRYPL